MNDIIIKANTLPEPLLRLMRTDRIKVHTEEEGVISLIPISEPIDCTKDLFGIFSDGKMSADKYSERKQTEKELEI
ncbi:MAG: hypothetical protein LBT23_09915 [Synergistaceae bacterium]|jgi:hypothetical protein|nr:hypothetical protein [Synergistaceae bacterium]